MSKEWWQEHGYLYGRKLDRAMYPDLWVVVAEMVFTWRLMLCTPDGALEFWCYPKAPEGLEGAALTAAMLDSLGNVLTYAAEFDGQGDPADGWVKHHPSHRRRRFEHP